VVLFLAVWCVIKKRAFTFLPYCLSDTHLGCNGIGKVTYSLGQSVGCQDQECSDAAAKLAVLMAVCYEGFIIRPKLTGLFNQRDRLH
jgi:hypothetical protein